jgi:transcriptional regulator GlxA family with amidase domain
MTNSIGIYIYPDAEVLDFAGPYEVFTTASRVFRRATPGEPEPFRVFTVARTTEPVRARAGLVFVPSFGFADHPPIDLQLVASVCTGAYRLARTGLLDNLTATTHWEDVAEMQTLFPLVNVVEGRRWVDEGQVVASAGISAGIDMSLHLVERLAGRELARRTARQMDFDWRQNA